MKKIILLFALVAVYNLSAQQVTNLILVGPEGVTDDVKKAQNFIVVKSYPEHYERMDYKMSGPLIKLRSYKDSVLKILDGRYFEYRPNGKILYSGHYSENKKHDRWFTYDDTGKVIISQRFENDILVETENLDKKDSTIDYYDDREAEFRGGIKSWINYLTKSLEKSEIINNTNGGQVVINFAVDIDGEIKDSYVVKSVDYGLDENSLEIINKSPKWKPAWSNGKAMKAYRKQPITYAPSE